MSDIHLLCVAHDSVLQHAGDHVELSWDKVGVRFVRGGGGVWHPDYPSLSREWFKHNLIDYDLWYIWHGEGYLRESDGRTTPLHPGACLWMRPGSIFEVWRKPGSRFGTRFFHFELHDDAGRRIAPSTLADIPLLCDVANLPHFEATTRRMTDLIVQRPLMSDETSRHDVNLTVAAMLKSLLMDFLLASRIKLAYELHGIDEDHVQLTMRLVSLIHENPGHFDIEPFVARSGYSMDHFRRLFKRVVGQTPHQVVLNARIGRAKSLLKQTQLGVGEIADQLGYANVQYFSLQFKQIVGVGPSAFRDREKAG